MTKEEIKKELYKQNPIAEYSYTENGNKIYSCELILDNVENEIIFSIPISESVFENKIYAKWLIRWIK